MGAQRTTTPPPPPAPPAVPGAQIDEVQYAPTVEAMSQVFSVYGPLAKMSIMNRAGMWQALVQYRDAKAAAAAKQYLDGFAMYPGGANKVGARRRRPCTD